MTVALRQIEPLSTAKARPAAAGRLERIEIVDTMAAAASAWRALEAADTLATPYQRYDFLSLWQRHVGQPQGISPFIVIGLDAGGEPIMVLPFGRRPLGGLQVVEFLGGKHCNFNVALWRRDIAASVSEADIRGVVARLSGKADALLLANQSLTWQGMTNPFALLPHQLSPSMGYSGALTPDFDALLRARTNSTARKKMRKKEQALASFGPVRFERVQDEAAARHALDTFFKQKSVRMQVRGIHDVFAEPDVRRFFEAAATTPSADGGQLIELYTLSVGDIIVATFGGTSGGGRFCGMFNSMIPDRYQGESPGEQLLVHLVRDCCRRGLTTFDLGVGEAYYKKMFCPDAEPLFDSFIALSPAGHLLVTAMRWQSAVKRLVKRTPALWSMVGAARRLHAALSGSR